MELTKPSTLASLKALVEDSLTSCYYPTGCKRWQQQVTKKKEKKKNERKIRFICFKLTVTASRKNGNQLNYMRVVTELTSV
jgi:hypothetical protein